MSARGETQLRVTPPAYSAARAAASCIAPQFARLLGESGNKDAAEAVLPGLSETEAMIDAGFWASLRREEGRIPKISLAYLRYRCIKIHF